MKTLLIAFVAFSTTQAFACPGNVICKDDRIIDESNITGVVEAVYSNGKAKVRLDGYSNTYIRDTNSIAKGVSCLGQLCAQTRVIEESNITGNVVEVFTNGKVKVELDGYSNTYIRQARSLGLAVRCLRHLCVNQRIIEESNISGNVLEIYSNGKVKVQLDGYSNTYIRQADRLGKGRACFRNLCVGDRIIEESNITGTVVEIYNNHDVKVKLDGYSNTYIRSFSSLGRGYRCIDEACVGDDIIDSSNTTGKIVALFSNGKVQVQLDGYSNTYIRQYTDLGLKLSCRPGEDCFNCRD